LITKEKQFKNISMSSSRSIHYYNSLIFRFKISKTREDYYILAEEDEKIEDENVFYYVKQAEVMKTLDRRMMFIDVKHLLEYDTTYQFSEAIFLEYYR